MQPHVRFAVVVFVPVVLYVGALILPLLPEERSRMTPVESKAWIDLGVAAVGAFFGGASAFFLVIANDWRRARRRARRNLPAMLSRERLLARSHIEGTTHVRSEAQSGRLSENVSLYFSSNTIQRFADELSDRLSERQLMGLYNIAFAMKSADEMNARSVETVQRISETSMGVRSGAARAIQDLPQLYQALDHLYGAELFMLERVEKLIDGYLTDTLNERGDVG